MPELFEAAPQPGARAPASDVPEAEREFSRGLEFHRAGQLDQALKHYAKTVGRDPGHAMAWNNMGVVLRRQGKRRAALACYRRAAALKPEDPTHHSNLG